jgi:O-antigen ligase
MFGIVEEFYPEISIFHLVRPLGSYMPRVSSLMQNPNPFGALMSLGIIYSILLRKDETINRAEFIISMILFAICAFLSGSRNAVFVLLAGITILFIYREISLGKNIMKWIISLTSGCLFLFFIYIISEDQSRYIMQHYVHGEGSDRLLLFNRALHEFAHRPITGIGIEVFSKHIGTQVLGRDVYHTHNIILNIMVELGAVGLILSIFTIYYILKGVNFRVHKIAIAVIIIFVSQMFDYYFHDVTYAAVSFYLMASAANSQYE